MKPEFVQGPMQPGEPTHCSECDRLFEDCECGECADCGRWVYDAYRCSICVKPYCKLHIITEQGCNLCESCYDHQPFPAVRNDVA